MIDVEGINIKIAGDISGLDAAARRVRDTLHKIGRDTINNAQNIKNTFDNIQRQQQALKNLFANLGIKNTAENIRILNAALKEEEAQIKKNEKAYKDYQQQRVNAIKAGDAYNKRMKAEADRAQRQQYHTQDSIANKAALYSGLASGTLVGGRLGFAGGFFGGRIGSYVGSSIGNMFGATAGAAGGVVGGALGGIGGTALAAGAKVMEMYLKSSLALMERIGGLAHDFLSTSLKLGITYEKQIVSLQGLTGSKEVGSKLYNDIEKIAIKSPYKTSQLIPQAEMLLGAGVKPDQIPAYLSRVGDLAGGNMERFHFIAKAMADVNAVGHLRGQELNQFANQGIMAKDFAKVMGLENNMPKFMRKMEQGEVNPNVMFEMVEGLTNKGGRFHNRGQEIATGTVGGALDSLGETIESFQKKFGDMILKKFNIAAILNKVLNGFGDIDMKKVEKWVERAAKAFTPLGETLLKFGDYLLEIGANLGESLPSWEEFASVISDSVDRYLPFFINTLKVLGIATLAIGRTFLSVGDWFIGVINTITQSMVFKKVIGDVGEIPQVARAGTIDKWMKDLQTGLKKSPDPIKIINGKWDAKNAGPLQNVMNNGDPVRPIEEQAGFERQPPGFDKHTNDMISKIDNEIATGIGSFEKFDKGIARLANAWSPSNGAKSQIGEKEFGVGALDLFKSLESDMKDFMDKPAVAAFARSGSAQDIINANLTSGNMDIGERTLAVIEAAKVVQEQQKEVQTKILDAIKKYNTNQILNEFGF